MAPETESWTDDSASAVHTAEQSSETSLHCHGNGKASKKNAEKQANGKNSRKQKGSKGREGPSRPLSAYNLFFQEERIHLLASLPVRPEGKPRRSHGKIGFADMAKLIGSKWKALTPQEKERFQFKASQERERYDREIKAFKQQKKNQEKQQHEDQEANNQAPVASAAPIATTYSEPDQVRPGLQDCMTQYPTTQMPSGMRDSSGMSSQAYYQPGQYYASEMAHYYAHQQPSMMMELPGHEKLSFQAPVAAFEESPMDHYAPSSIYPRQDNDFLSFDLEPLDVSRLVPPSYSELASKFTQNELNSFVDAFR